MAQVVDTATQLQPSPHSITQHYTALHTLHSTQDGVFVYCLRKNIPLHNKHTHKRYVNTLTTLYMFVLLLSLKQSDCYPLAGQFFQQITVKLMFFIDCSKLLLSKISYLHLWHQIMRESIKQNVYALYSPAEIYYIHVVVVAVLPEFWASQSVYISCQVTGE